MSAAADPVNAEERVLILAPTGRDAPMLATALRGAGLAATVTASMPRLTMEMRAGAGVLVVAEEAFDGDAIRLLAAALDAQPPWSDITVVVLAGTDFSDNTDRAARVLGPLRNVLVLERPVRVPVLLTAVRVAVRGRRRQYELRGYLDLARQVAEERARMLASEQAARREAEAASRLRDEFLATVSHELRTPLNVILGWSGLLAGEAADAARRAKAAAIIHRNAQAQAHVIDELLDVSRITTGKLRLQVEPFDVTALLAEVIDGVRLATDAKAIRLEFVREPLPVIAGDRERLRQVFWNLLTNAAKFTNDGGRILVCARPHARGIEVRVSDDGVGIAPEVLPYVFDRFRQADSTPARAHGGLGLGLAIVRQIVEMHGGEVAAASPGIGRGAEFIVTLPARLPALRTAREDDRGAARTAPAAAPAVRLDGIRVLVVDDDPDGRDMVAEILRLHGAAVTECGGAVEAMAAAASAPPDVLITDIAMPHVDGYELIERLHAMAEGEPPPAVALTAYARPEDADQARRAGYSAHLAKPVDRLDLIATIRTLYDARRSPSTHRR